MIHKTLKVTRTAMDLIISYLILGIIKDHQKIIIITKYSNLKKISSQYWAQNHHFNSQLTIRRSGCKYQLLCQIKSCVTIAMIHTIYMVPCAFGSGSSAVPIQSEHSAQAPQHLGWQQVALFTSAPAAWGDSTHVWISGH